MTAAFLAISLISSSQCLAADPGVRERAFVRALELFDSAKSPTDYRESARVLESILTDGYQNGAVFYNLGNAYYRAGDYGRAILNYRKAKPFMPGDPYLSANLAQALVAAPGRLTSPPDPWWKHVFFWTDWFSYPTKVYATAAGLCGVALIFSAALLLRKPRLQLLAAFVLLVSASLGIDTFLRHQETASANLAVITAETIARKGMDDSYEPAFNQPLRDGAEFRILAEKPDWTFGHFESIGDGWVRNEFIAR